MKKINEFIHVFFFCIPLAIVVYVGCMIGILIFNLIKFMDTKKINDINVKDYDVVSRDFDAVIKRLDIENAKELLKREGYFVDALWTTDEVTMNYKCTEEQAHIVLFEALTDDGTEQHVYDMIHQVARVMNLKSIDE